jgi:hypothetical protein
LESRCLHRNEIPLDLRVVGALLLPYGLPLNRIVGLTTDRLTPDGLQHSLVRRALAWARVAPA